jgi:pimeloyl-ACP methyl ester carboxylesterase
MVRHRCCPRRPPRGELRSTCQDSVLLIGRFAAAAVDVLGLDWFLLVVHDIGGPVGFEVTAAALDRVASLVGTEFTGGG